MNTTHKLATLAATLALAATGTAFGAATPAPHATHGTCESLTTQVDSALAGAGVKNPAKAEEARKQRDVGEKDCKAGKYEAGAAHLRKALTDLGMKPVN